ncbi:MAG: hypothetical protein FWH07_05845 [Oscillospiraceae bacterium]|nr:hypothetical protein [Oscillospiraceae bacterium]
MKKYKIPTAILLTITILIGFITIPTTTATVPTLTVNAANATRIGFGGKQWSVIGYGSVGDGTPGDTVTLLLADASGNTYGTSAFRTGQSSHFNNSTQYTDNRWYANNPQGPNWDKPNEYRGSTLQQRLEEIAYGLKVSSPKEESLIIPRKLSDVNVENARLWPLSANEAENTNDALRRFSDPWGLRSPTADYGFAVLGCHANGGIATSGANVDYVVMEVRPALQLDLQSVLFASDNTATGGKSAAVISTPTSVLSGNNIKFTVRDESLNLERVTTAYRDGTRITFEYSGATVGKTLSAVIMRNGEVLHYYKLSASVAAQLGATTLYLPSGYNSTTDTLWAFVEEANGVNQTDFASEFVRLCDLSAHFYDEQTDCTVAVTCNGCLFVAYPAKEHTLTAADCTACGDCQAFPVGEHTPKAADCTACEDCAVQLTKTCTIGKPCFLHHPTVGFGGKQWAVIGYDSVGDETPSDTLTLLLADVPGNTYVTSVFRTGSSSQFDNSTRHFNNYWYANNPSGMDNWNEPREYLGSTLQQLLEEIADGLPLKENALIIPRDLPGGGGDSDLSNVAGPAVEKARLWALSLGEAQNVNNTLRGFSTSYWWWLRSSGSTPYNATAVYSSGNIYVGGYFVHNGSNGNGGVRPALQLNLESVIFTSDNTATGGKSAVTIGGGFVQLQPSDNIKFTMPDDSLELASVKPTARDGDTITFNYNGATPGETLSAVVMRNGEVAYYGKLVDSTDENGTDVKLTLPGDFNAATDTIQVFVEETNGVNQTDFASAFVRLCDLEVHDYGVQTNCVLNVYCKDCGSVVIPKKEQHTPSGLDCTICDVCPQVFGTHNPTTADCTICKDCPQTFASHNPTDADCTKCEDCPIISGTHTPQDTNCTKCQYCMVTLREHVHDEQTDLTKAVYCKVCSFEVFDALQPTEFSIVGDKIVIRNNTNKFISTKGYYLVAGDEKRMLPAMLIRPRSAITIGGGKRGKIDLSTLMKIRGYGRIDE